MNLRGIVPDADTKPAPRAVPPLAPGCGLARPVPALLIGIISLATVMLPLLLSQLGLRLAVVKGGSMEPAIPVGSLAIIRDVNTQDVAPGDVITFQRGDELVTHRVIAADPTTQRFRTKGDANGGPDRDEVPASAIRGRFLGDVPELGYAANFLASRLGFVLFVLVPAFALLLPALREFAGAVHSLRPWRPATAR